MATKRFDCIGASSGGIADVRYASPEGALREIYYRADGSAIADIHFHTDHDNEEHFFWDSDGQAVTRPLIREEVDNALIHYQTLLFTLGEDYAHVFKSDPQHNPFAITP